MTPKSVTSALVSSLEGKGGSWRHHEASIYYQGRNLFASRLQFPFGPMFDGKKTICMIISRFNDEMTAMLIGFDPFFEGGLI